MSLWAGQGVRLARTATAAELVRSVAEGAEAALAGAGRPRGPGVGGARDRGWEGHSPGREGP